MNGEPKEQGETVSLPDGRQLGYLVVGEGKPVFCLHGRPGSRIDALRVEPAARSRHLQLIGVDRPGIGLSTYAPNRRLRDHASEIAFLADKLGIEKFAIVGLYGGGVYALICAALLSKRLTRVVVVGGESLPPEPGLLWRIPFALAILSIVTTWVSKMSLNQARDPDAFWDTWTGRGFRRFWPEDDFKFYASPSEARDSLFQSVVEAYRQGSDAINAINEEHRLVRRGGDVDLSQIPPGLVHIWHGTADRPVPVGHAYRNAKAVPEAHIRIFKGEGHTFIVNHLEELAELLSS